MSKETNQIKKLDELLENIKLVALTKFTRKRRLDYLMLEQDILERKYSEIFEKVNHPIKYRMKSWWKLIWRRKLI